ncbi:Methyltransferase domain-containing protein [Salinihabitans flavidus]|uniref:Methyltransferase domain-containing protein n=1 Tax=Salinihabitans flavidus TaxID=569882 RepID=A0A1H8S1L0_9RHOB|nr:class I SAM-dependent methyltransferase [Salinihabitans flavidus]SEO72427.1 Methyltransferase domain-containing protein [Salinihabitans flavidus]
MTKSPMLEDAYALRTPQDSVKLYADWAGSYDSDFAAANDYQLPRLVAEHYVRAGGQAPVLDVGAGTGLCGEELKRLGMSDIDATDISQDMLDVAADKSVYRRLFTGDLTQRLDAQDNTYAGIVSSGTFTTGHVGPEAFDELLRVTRPGGLLAISINAKHYQAAGFEAKLKALSGAITDLTLPQERFYGPDANGEHKNDKGVIALFRKS